MKGQTKMKINNIRFLIKSKLEDYNDKAIKNKYKRYIDKKYLETLPRILNRNLIKYPIIFSMLEEENIIRCLIATNGKPSVNTHNGVNHISLDMSLKDYKKLPIVSALK